MATSTAKKSLDMVAARNSASFASPTWVVMTAIVKDVSINLSKNEGDASSRGSKYELKRGTLRPVSIELTVLNIPADADLVAMQDAYDNDSIIEIALATGAIATSGTVYRRFECEVFDISESQPLNDMVTLKVTLKPTYTGNVQGARTTVA
jgi:hypothetical protein